MQNKNCPLLVHFWSSFNFGRWRNLNSIIAMCCIEKTGKLEYVKCVISLNLVQKLWNSYIYLMVIFRAILITLLGFAQITTTFWMIIYKFWKLLLSADNTLNIDKHKEIETKISSKKGSNWAFDIPKAEAEGLCARTCKRLCLRYHSMLRDKAHRRGFRGAVSRRPQPPESLRVEGATHPPEQKISTIWSPFSENHQYNIKNSPIFYPFSEKHRYTIWKINWTRTS